MVSRILGLCQEKWHKLCFSSGVRVKYFIITVGLFVESFYFLLGVPFGTLPLAWRFYHIFLSSQVVNCYNTDPLVKNSSNNVFTVGFELCYGNGSSKFFYVNNPFVSGKDNPEKEAVHKVLGCTCAKSEDRDFVRKAALKDSEFLFLCEFDALINALEETGMLKGVKIVRIHGCSALDMCKHCYLHMSSKLTLLRDVHEDVSFELCISSFFDYEKDYEIKEAQRPELICCILLRKKQEEGKPRVCLYELGL